MLYSIQTLENLACCVPALAESWVLVKAQCICQMAWARGLCCPADSDLEDPDGSDCRAFGGQMACVEVMCVCVYALTTGGFNSL